MTEEKSRAFPEQVTIREKYAPAMAITDQDEANAYFERCVEHTMEYAPDAVTREEAERVERSNLGYYAGYYDTETRIRVERLFNCSHPVFGKVEAYGEPNSEDAFYAGLERGRNARQDPGRP